MIPADWIFGLLGGLMIGAAAAMFLLVNGRIMGASGILGGVVDGSGRGNLDERFAFLAGLVGVPAVVALVWQAPQTNLTTDPLLLVVAGLLVGLGTRMGSGCTSGHGVCGISRFSKRGIVATLVYLAAGVIAMAVARHGLGVI
ncbi:YeeE/YedE family protein [Roseovarius aestuariivivens]|uniref:YeeE/YedE family protein n=1 Tax=Roseovarius aestuariivivens TaxID=1888910 RepID=UPI00108147D4|nr:YeeE/YedE thiosulfate transporter family protein [Roseovarius aestuariivivens]